MRILKPLLLTLPLIAAHGEAMSAMRHPPAHIPMGETADAPSGFDEMCATDATLCASAASSDLPVSASLLPEDGSSTLTAAPAPKSRPQAWPALLSEAFETPSFESLVRGKTSFANLPLPQPMATAHQPFTSAALASTSDPDASNPNFSDGGETAMHLLKKINRRVNHNVRQTSDLQLYGVDELWRPAGDGPNAAGDCEDIALEKRNELIRAGISADALFLATVYVPGRGLHTIMLARLPEGDFALDSLTPEVVRWDRLSYIWLRIQSPDNPREWHRLGSVSNT